MRVEAYNQVQQIYQTPKKSKSQQIGSATQTDQLQISSFGKEFHLAKGAVASAPDIREDVTAPIKARIQNGTYGVDNMAFAEKLLSRFDEMI
jgi:negative regulator of flagellin synthesis FlgM